MDFPQQEKYMSSKFARSLILTVFLLGVLPACGPASVLISPTETRPPSVPTPLSSATTLPSTPIAEATRTTAPASTLVASTTTPTFAPPPHLSQSPDLILAANKPARPSSWPGNVVYKLPETEQVLLAHELIYFNKMKVDIYYPPDYKFENKLPVVILSHGFVETKEYDKDIPSHMDWAKLIAASGMIAVSAQAGENPTENFYHVLDYLAANAGVLGIDMNRIGFWACSTQGKPMFHALEDSKLAYRAGFKAAVFTYLDLHAPDPGIWPKNISLFVVKAGSDHYIDGSIIDHFVANARQNKISVEYIELQNAPHGFDSMLDTQESKDTIAKALAFLRSKLLE